MNNWIYKSNIVEPTSIHKIDYNERRGVEFVIKSFLVVRHLELILPLISLHALSFFSLVLTGNLLKTNIFSEFNLVVSRHFLSWLPSVLLPASPSLLKKCGSNFNAHKCRSVCGFERACWMVFILVGVTRANQLLADFLGCGSLFGGRVHLGGLALLAKSIQGVVIDGCQVVFFWLFGGVFHWGCIVTYRNDWY